MTVNKLNVQKEDVKAHFQGNWRGFYSHYLKLQNGNGNEYKAVCPFHDDSDPSLSINNDTGLFNCFGCDAQGDALHFYGKLKGLSSFQEVLQSIADDFNIIADNGNKPGPGRIVVAYDYTNSEGALLYQAVRMDPKVFRQRRPDGNDGWIWNMKDVDRVLYRLPEVLQADLVCVVEGEKDADNVSSLGLAVTTNVGGAEKWRAEYSESLKDKDIVILPDKDEPGRKHGQKVARMIHGIAKSVKVIQLPGLPEKGDVSDWIESGGTKEALQKLIDRTEEWVPEDHQMQWQKPVLLDDYRIPHFDRNCLPGTLGKMAVATATATETPIELAAGICLATVATAVHGKMNVRVKPGYKEPLNVWIGVFLDPGNRKSSVLALIITPLISWENMKREEMAPIIKQIESERKNQEARLKFLRQQLAKTRLSESKEIQQEIFDIEMEMEEVALFPKVWADDVTPEHFGTLLGQYGGKMAVISSEGGIFDTIGGRYSGGIPNLDIFLKSHSGDSVRVDRGSRDSIDIENPTSTFGLSPQPDVLKSIAGIKGSRGRGFLGRFLYFLPTSNLGYRTLKSEFVSDSIKIEWQSTIHNLLEIESQKGQNGQVEPYIINLSSSAYQEWSGFFEAVEADMREGGRFELITDWAGKLPGAAARLAGLLHCTKHPHQPWAEKISLETMSQALDLAATFASHAEIAYNIMGADQAIEGARKVWRWIGRGRFSSFKKNDCYNALKGSFPRVRELEPSLEVLVERNYLATPKLKSSGPGRPSIQYIVNPELTRRWA